MKVTKNGMPVEVESLPSQTGEDGKYLKTNGINATWNAVNGDVEKA